MIAADQDGSNPRVLTNQDYFMTWFCFGELGSDPLGLTPKDIKDLATMKTRKELKKLSSLHARR